jgi:hypothetical protein
MSFVDALRRIWTTSVLLLVVAVLVGCAGQDPQQLAEKNRLLTSYPPPGEARIWLFRNYQPEITREEPYVRINGRIVGAALLGRAFYYDVPPGSYEITVDSRGTAPFQFAHFGLAAGQTAYVAIDVNNWWAGLCWRCQIDTFYTIVQTPQLALAQMASMPIGSGG